jgi:hypothetical protein
MLFYLEIYLFFITPSIGLPTLYNIHNRGSGNQEGDFVIRDWLSGIMLRIEFIRLIALYSPGRPKGLIRGGGMRYTELLA